MAGAVDVTRLFESSGGPTWCGPFAAPGESPPRLGSDDGRQAGRTQPSRPASTRILLIDDQATDLDSLRLILVLQGYEADCVQSGVEGLRRALSGDYGLVILDLHLPDLEATPELGRSPMVSAARHMHNDGHSSVKRDVVIDVLLQPANEPRTIVGNILIRTSSPSMPDLRIPVRGYVV